MTFIVIESDLLRSFRRQWRCWYRRVSIQIISIIKVFAVLRSKPDSDSRWKNPLLWCQNRFDFFLKILCEFQTRMICLRIFLDDSIESLLINHSVHSSKFSFLVFETKKKRKQTHQCWIYFKSIQNIEKNSSIYWKHYKYQVFSKQFSPPKLTWTFHSVIGNLVT